MTRTERAVALRAEGLFYREIADRLGVSVSRAAELVTDPTGEKARVRKARGSRLCLGGCGRRVNTDGRRTAQNLRCLSCEGERQRTMSVAWFLESVAEWVERFGSPPSSVDWNPAAARAKGMAWKADRYEATERPWPSPTTAQKHWGSWNAALEAAGYPPVAPGEYRDGRSVAQMGNGCGDREAIWTREAVFAAIDRWHDVYGRMPSSIDWRLAGDDRPTVNTVRNVFGTWTAAIASYVDEHLDAEAVAA